jgi:hypothetical protein
MGEASLFSCYPSKRIDRQPEGSQREPKKSGG